MSTGTISRQRGYANAILMLSVLSGLVLSSSVQSLVIDSRLSVTEADRQTITSAREALIAYSVNYMELYGARGAGPGHLPCPDTDAKAGSTIDQWKKDGPNPPCGQQPVATGWLPRHANVNHGRYRFHSDARQRLWYAVANEFVNNPVNRIVNPASSSGLDVLGNDGVIAIIAAPYSEAEFHAVSDWWLRRNLDRDIATVGLIRDKDVLLPAISRVGEWIESILNRTLTQYCSVPQDTDHGCTVNVAALASCGLSQFELLALWLAPELAHAGCDEIRQNLSVRHHALDDVPLLQHWFVRNRWHEFLRITVNDACKRFVSHCRFVFTNNTKRFGSSVHHAMELSSTGLDSIELDSVEFYSTELYSNEQDTTPYHAIELRLQPDQEHEQ